MKCEWVRENITLHLYGELADDVRHELEQHIARCADCAAELKAAQEFHALLSEAPAVTPSPNLVAASRMRLQEALETTEQGRFWQRLIFNPAAWLQQIRFSPALAAVILMLGFAGGVLTTYKATSDHSSLASLRDGPTVAPTEASIGGIRSITQQPGNQVSIQYDTISTQHA